MPKFRDLVSLFAIFLRLGVTSFGGSVAHFGYFHKEFVTKRRWIEEEAYTDLVALSQFLPGPASSQIGFALGITRAGILGGLVAWLAFTLPSALIMAAYAHFLGATTSRIENAALHGLALAAVAVVAWAVMLMARSLCPDTTRACIAIVALMLVLALPGFAGQMLALILGGLWGWFLFGKDTSINSGHVPAMGISRRVTALCLITYAMLLFGLPLAAQLTANGALELFQRFYKAGALVFGGGHVVLPFLRSEFVTTGLIDDKIFLSGYGAAQALPGPLFTFAAFLGGVMPTQPNGWIGSFVALIAIFLPGFLLMLGALPYWDQWRMQPKVRAIVRGINAAVVGLLAAALVMLLTSSTVASARDVCLILVALALLAFAKLPSWSVVLLCAAGSTALAIL